jgi:PAS domain S-box-containing protein
LDFTTRFWTTNGCTVISIVTPGADHISDARALNWPVDSKSYLPAGTLTLLIEPSVWGRYSHYSGAGIIFLLVEASLIGVLLLERKRRKRAQASLARRFALERVVSEVSTKLSNCPAAEVDSEIEKALNLILQAEAADRVCWYAIPEGQTTVVKISSASRPGVPPGPEQFEEADVPWIAERLSRGEAAAIGKLEKLPPEADRDRQHLSELWIQSIAFVPTSSGTAAKGLLIVVHLDREREWPGALVSRLAVLGNLFGSAMARKRAQEAEQTSGQQFGALFEQASLGIALEDEDGRILFANPALCAMLGYTQQEMSEMHCAQFARPEDAEEDWQLFQKLRGGLIDSYRIEKRYVRPSGEEVWGNLHVSALRGGHGESPRVIAMVEDVTERKAVNEQISAFHLQREQLTGRLIQAQEEERQRISRELHDDIGQRLALLTFALDRINRDLPASLTTLGTELTNLMGQANELTTDIHQLSHELHSTKLQHLGLKAALNELCRQTGEKRAIVVDLQVSDLPSISSEIQLCLYRVAQEALNNVLKHSGTGRVTVNLDGNDRLAQLRITDWGIGFDIALTTPGLGLASMRERLRIVGGTLQVNSRHGQGTEITAQVPLAGDANVAKAS